MKIKNKILFILIFVLFMLISTRCYAANTNLYFDNPNLDNLGALPTVSGCDDYIIIGTESCSVASIYFIRNTNDAKEKVSISYTDSTNAQLKTSISFKTWYRFSSGAWSQRNTTVTSVNMNLSSQRILYSTIDLKDTDGNVLFPASNKKDDVIIKDSSYNIIFGEPAYDNHATFPEHKYEYIIKDLHDDGIVVFYTNWEMCMEILKDGTSVFRPVETGFLNYSEHEKYFFSADVGRYYYSFPDEYLLGGDLIRFNKYYSYAFGYDTNPKNFYFNNGFEILSCSLDVYIYDNIQNVLTDKIEKLQPLKYPYILNTETLKSVEFDYLCINAADFYGEKWQDFYLLCYDYSTQSADTLSIYPRKEILITRKSQYLSNTEEYYTFMIPRGHLGIDYKNR